MKKLLVFTGVLTLLTFPSLYGESEEIRKKTKIDQIIFAIKIQDMLDKQFMLVENYTKEYFTIIEDTILDSEEKIERLEGLLDDIKKLELIPTFAQELITQITRFIEAV